LLRLVWINLISNSIKFSLPKERPEIVVSGFAEGNNVTYTIKDNGVGFNPKFRSKLFELFQHLHNVDEFEGSGVGLTIVQRIIRRLGGQIWGDGQPDIGAEFSFTLPGQK
jgi:signal transduction histidine kinase